MTNVLNYEVVVKNLIDDLKAIFNNYGLGGGGFEYKIMSEVFTYKLLNDKLIREIKLQFGYDKDKDGNIEDFILNINDEDYEGFLEFLDETTAKMDKHHFLFNLFNQSEGNIYKIFDDTLLEISELNKDIFAVNTSDGQRHHLFEAISEYVKKDTDSKNKFAKAIIERLSEESFEAVFEQNFDFFSHIFEYLIKDYNTNSGIYSEFYTPKFAGDIIARIMVKDNETVTNVKLNDPSAGSGMLLITLANRIGIDNCSLYSQDISQKSSDFLRLNLILNGMTKSLDDIIQGDTLVDPYHKENNQLMKFDYIVANPPFKNDFSASVDTLKNDPYLYVEKENDESIKRFFAGVPNVPKKDKDGMPIYLMFIQHILASLKDNGKACIVVPSGFCTDTQSSIAKEIRKTLVDKNYLEGVIQMPSNIFSNTGTNVSIISINKAKENDDVILIDASGLGNKVKFDSGQRTVLSIEDETQIIDTYHNKTDLDNFSKKVSINEIKENGYQVNPGRYFDVKFEELLSGEELDSKINELVLSLKECFNKSNELQENVLKQLGGIVNE